MKINWLGFLSKLKKRSANTLSQQKQKPRIKSKIQSINKSRENWDRKWNQPDYTPHWDLTKFPESLQKLIDQNIIQPNHHLLDIGCGTGKLALMMAQKGFKVSAFDFAKPAIDKAKNHHYHEGLHFFQADATNLPNDMDQFDIGIDRGALHGIPPKYHTNYCTNLSKIIKPNGLLIIQFAYIRFKIGKAEQLPIYLEDLFKSSFVLTSTESITMESTKFSENIEALQLIFKRR